MPLSFPASFGAIGSAGFGDYDGSGNGPIQSALVPASADEPFITSLSETSFVISYRDVTEGNDISGVAVSRSGTTLTAGSEVDIAGGSPTNVRTHSVALDSSRVCFGYRNTSDFVRARVGTVTGTTLGSFGSETTIESGVGHGDVSMAVMDTDKVLVAYGRAFGGAGNRSGAVILSITGSSIVVNTIATGAPNPLESSLTMLDSGKALWLYLDASVGQLRAVILSVSGTTVTFGTPVTVKTGALSDALAASVCPLDSGRALVAYVDEGDSDKGKAQILSISGTVITTNTEFEFAPTLPANNDYQIGATLVESDKIMLVWRDTGTIVESRVATVSGTTITYGTTVQLTATGDHPHIASINKSGGGAVAVFSSGGIDGIVIQP